MHNFIRAATPADAPAARQCIASAFERYIERIGKPPAPMLLDVASEAAADHVWMATAGDEVLGVLVQYPSSEGFYLDTVAVKPAFHGKGIGRALLEFAETEAVRRGYDSIYLCTNSKMTENQVLYPRIGYVEIARKMDAGYDRVFYRKWLSGGAAVAAKVRPVYRRDGDQWLPAPEAKGPFPGQHGGAVAGMLAACLEAEGQRLEAGTALQCSTLLLRPVPVEACSVSVTPVRRGGRVTVLAAALRVGGKDCALAQAIFVRPQTVGDWEVPTARLHDPTGGELVPKPARFGSTRWFRDTVEVRRADGTFWLRSLRPVVDPMPPLARVCAHADWASGLSRPDSWDSPQVGGFPNADLSVHLAREPQGEWVGLRPRSTWHGNGMGMTDTEVLDVHGPVGRACHTLVLLPLVPS